MSSVVWADDAACKAAADRFKRTRSNNWLLTSVPGEPVVIDCREDDTDGCYSISVIMKEVGTGKDAKCTAELPYNVLCIHHRSKDGSPNDHGFYPEVSWLLPSGYVCDDTKVGKSDGIQIDKPSGGGKVHFQSPGHVGSTFQALRTFKWKTGKDETPKGGLDHRPFVSRAGSEGKPGEPCDWVDPVVVNTDN
ncbi:MAG: hypothetical protein HY021_09705 [Burkholderiales bacterium]|nr:hypothetical protein [Burkholderiales bacterium]